MDHSSHINPLTGRTARLNTVWRQPRPDQAPYRDGIARLFQAAYPGPYTPGSFSRTAEPATSVQELQTLAGSFVPRQPERTTLPPEYDDFPTERPSEDILDRLPLRKNGLLYLLLQYYYPNGIPETIENRLPTLTPGIPLADQPGLWPDQASEHVSESPTKIIRGNPVQEGINATGVGFRPGTTNKPTIQAVPAVAENTDLYSTTRSKQDEQRTPPSGNTQIADSSAETQRLAETMGFSEWDQIPPDPPTPSEGTWFYGGAGMDGDYIDDMVNALKEVGILNPQAVNPSGRTNGTVIDALSSAYGLRNRDDVAPDSNPVSNAHNQHNMIGYSYGSLVATQEALDHADKGGKVDNLVLIGSPISQEMLTQAREHPNIGSVIVIDLSEHGDPIYAGMTTSDILGSVLDIGQQFLGKEVYGDPAGDGHFYYGGEGPVARRRRRELAERLRDLGLR